MIIEQIIRLSSFLSPVGSQVILQKFGRNPFLLLVFCLLSLRSKDESAVKVACHLFEYADTPEKIALLSVSIIEKIIRSVGFYRKKALILITISDILVKKYAGIVPSLYDQLMQLPGVGPKTAQLVLAEGFLIPAICVDTHVHRLSNRLGLVKTKTVDATRFALERLIPQKDWNKVNRAFVAWGKNICFPRSPLCSECPLLKLCPRVGVLISR